MQDFLSHAIRQFPVGITSAFAYGSGVFQQNNNKPAKDNMIDLIFIVENPALWHKMNLEKHPEHYSFIKNFGPTFLAKIQTDCGASVYFNTLVNFEDRVIKYGVIAQDDLIDDLRNWKTLYVSGRLHKPVLKSEEFMKEPLKSEYYGNLESAVNASLLLLPAKFHEIDLYMAITSLSYTGDFRMTFGEDKNKVSNIVVPNSKEFSSLYKHTLNDSKSLQFNNSLWIQDVSPQGRLRLLKSLPSNLQEKFRMFANIETFEESDSNCRILTEDSKKCELLVRKSVASIVRNSSITQSIKGIVTAGVSKSVLYSLAKVRKMIKSIVK